MTEDSDADPDTDVLAGGSSGLLSGNKESGQDDYKNADRPWVKDVRMSTSSISHCVFCLSSTGGVVCTTFHSSLRGEIQIY